MDILTLLKRLLTKANTKGEWKMLLHLASGNNHDGVVLILLMKFSLLFIFYFVS
jgi:hypothetical protein